jgi:hypothetical protein
VEKKRPIESMERGHPVDASLFGSIGAMAAHVGEELAASFTGKRLAFMSIGQYQAIAGSGRLSEVNANILRHQKWQAGCVRAFAPQANFLTFAAALRGLLEAAQDAWYSLGPVLATITRDRTHIQSALSGNLREKGFLNRELEDRLVDFIYGRKVSKLERDSSPDSHVALDPKDYRNAIGLPDDEREMWRQLYDEICGSVTQPHSP